MNKEVKEELKEFIFQAIQAGKSESSNLASDIARKIREGNSDTVKRLDSITVTFSNFSSYITCKVTHFKQHLNKLSLLRNLKGIKKK